MIGVGFSLVFYVAGMGHSQAIPRTRFPTLSSSASLNRDLEECSLALRETLALKHCVFGYSSTSATPWYPSTRSRLSI